MRVIEVALNDLRLILRDRKSLLFLVAMPIAFTLFMGFAFSGAAKPPDPRLPVGWSNADGANPVTDALHRALLDSPDIRLVEADAATLENRVAKADLAGAVLVPAGYGEAVAAGEPAQLRLIADEASARGQSAQRMVSPAVSQVLSAAKIARLSTDGLVASGALAETERSTEFAAAFDAALAGWQETAETPLLRAERGDRPVSGDAMGGNAYNQSSPGIMVQFVIFSLVTSAELLVIERRTRTLQRMLSTSLRRWQVLAGHTLAMFTLVFGQIAMLVILGELALDVHYFRSPVGTLLISVALALWVAALGVLVGVLARSDEQAVLFSLIAMFFFTALGGAWFPLEVSGPAFRTIGHLTPGAWAMDGYQNILVRGLGWGSALAPSAIVLGYALLFFAAASWLFMRQSEA